ncbi:MAG: hypothetical protein ABI068_14395 [Ktedonobacterales bacterium]
MVEVKADRPSARLAFPARYALIALGTTLLAFEGYNFAGLGVSVTGWGAARMIGDTALGLALLLAATLPAGSSARWRRIQSIYERLRVLALLHTLALVVVSLLALSVAARLIFFTPPGRFVVTDVVAFTDEDARLVLRGANPYDPQTSAQGFLEALRRFPNVTPTPLRTGHFATGEQLPTKAQQAARGQRALAGPDPTAGGAFDPQTLHSYPALAFLLYVPLIWAGAPNILLLNLMVYLALLAWLTLLAPPSLRLWTCLAALAALTLILFSLLADTEVISVGFLLLAWHYRTRNWWASAILWGLGCAFKQYAWFFVPFFLLDAWLEQGNGWIAAAKRAGVALIAFLTPNLPFIILSPAAWWNSLWLPVTAPLFPEGVGLVGLSTGGALPFFSPMLYTALEVVTLLAALWAFIRWRPKLRESALLLALLPLLFAFRSLPNYFAVAPWLALYAANVLYARSYQRSSVSAPTSG